MFLPVLNKTRCCSTAVTKSLAPGIGNSQQVQKIRLFIVALRRHDSLGPPWSSRPRHDMSCISCVQLRFRIRPKLRDNYWNETVLWRISRRIDDIDVRGGYGGFIMFQGFIIVHDWLLDEGVWTAWVALQLVFSSTLWNVHELLRLFLGHSNTRRVIYLLAEPMAVSHPEKISAHDNGVRWCEHLAIFAQLQASPKWNPFHFFWAFFAMPSQLQAIRRTVVNPLMGFLQFYTPIIRMFMDFCYGMTIPRIHTYTIPCFDRSKCETYGSLDDLCVSIARWSGPAKRM